MRRILLAVLLTAAGVPLAAKPDKPLAGFWEGFLDNGVSHLPLSVEFTTTGQAVGGLITIPDLYVREYTLTNVRDVGGRLTFDLPLTGQRDTFDATRHGDFIQGRYAGRFYKTEAQAAYFILWRTRPHPPEYRREEVRFPNGEVTLAGTLFQPLSKGRHPAVVFLHGSGPQTRESYLRFFADLFARRGFATLFFDKRGTGESTKAIAPGGDTFQALASDALAGVELLRRRPDIDPDKVGLWGLSQGGWLAPLAASQSEHVAFVVAVSGGGVTPAEQEYFDDEIKLRDLKFPEDDIAAAIDLLKMADNVIRQRESWDTFARARAAAAAKPWFKYLDVYPVKIPQQAPVWSSRDPDLDFDPETVWEKVHVPVLAILGELDKSTPPTVTAERIEAFQRKAGNRDVTIRTFPGANHGLWAEKLTEGHTDWDRPAPGWLGSMLQWLDRRR